MMSPVLFILLGQSNAVGHGVILEENERIETPLKNVFGLTWENNPFPSDEPAVWRGFVTKKMNLGELTENFGSVANYLAPMWQEAVNCGEELSELYIVNISLGAQGVTEQYMWYPEREIKFVPGPIGVADISLTPYAENILSRVKKYFDGLGVKPKTYIHWRGGENDSLVPKEKLETCLPEIYRTIFTRLWNALEDKPKTVLHRIVCDTRAFDFNPIDGLSIKSMGYINNVFCALAEEFENVEVFDATKIPGYTLATEERGIFLSDKVHFTAEANKWVAEKVFEEIKEG
ncbi:MAG: hypothetical protein II350_06010 [Clostridia bacterium]|nr:hypothetical protein [Clostridia bacterium]